MNHVLVSVLPNNVTLPPMGVQGFSAAVLGATNQNVVWQVHGTGCGTAGSCGAVTPAGTYTAPPVPPTPYSLQVVALSQDDPNQSGTASVTISNAPNILTLHPASVYAGGVNGFTLRVDGSGFIPSTPGPSSKLILGGTARVTTCANANSCSAPVTTTDVAQAGNLSVKLQNPDLTASQTVQLVIAPPGAHVVAVDISTGAAIAGTLGGWSCKAPGPVQFDGGYLLEHLPVGHSYSVYAEPLDGTVSPAEVSNALVTLRRNATTDPGWPPAQGCVVPPVNTEFTSHTRPAP